MTPQEAIRLLLAQAAKDADTQEIPRGSNRGPRVEQMLRYTGLGGGYPWCAAAVAAWGIESLALSWPVPHTADCDAILAWARRKGCLYKSDPKPGDIFLRMKSEDDATHTGIVVRNNGDGTVETWEGNTNNGGSREGYRVCNREARSVSGLYFVRWVEAMGAINSMPRPLETPAFTVLVRGIAFPKVQIRSGRPCLPIRAAVASIKGISSEATTDMIAWDASRQIAIVSGVELPGTYLQSDGEGRSVGWAPAREIGEALGCDVSVNGEQVTIGLPPTTERTEP